MTVDGWTLAVDFGTSFTSVATMDARGRDDFVEIDGQRWMPSSVFWQVDGNEGDGELLLGEDALNAADLAPECLERCPKRRLGREQFMTLGPKRLEVTDAIGEIFRHAASEAKWRQGGGDPRDVRLTHPARWKGTRLAELFKAAEVAGFPQPVLLPEPVGAAVFFATEKAQVGKLQIDERVAVFDLGGGTFDTAVLARTNDGFKVIGAPGGNEYLGGEDFDERLYRYLGEQLDEEEWHLLQSESSDRPWRRASLDFRNSVRRAKEKLSREGVTQATVRVPPPVDRELTVSRSEFEDMIRSDIKDTVAELQRTIVEAPETSVENLRAIYLAGGSSRIPLVKKVIEEDLGMEPDTLGEPKEAISRGAVRALRAIPAPESQQQVRPPRPVPPSQPESEAPRQEQTPPPRPEPEAPRQEKPPRPPKPVAPTPAGPGNIRSHLVFAWISIFLFFPTAIPAIYYGYRVKRHVSAGKEAEAARASKRAFRFSMLSLVIFVVAVGISVATAHHGTTGSTGT
jgi:molecular chaperone DnaK (HSP70)